MLHLRVQKTAASSTLNAMHAERTARQRAAKTATRGSIHKSGNHRLETREVMRWLFSEGVLAECEEGKKTELVQGSERNYWRPELLSLFVLTFLVAPLVVVVLHSSKPPTEINGLES
jgi:hypothetical protein